MKFLERLVVLSFACCSTAFAIDNAPYKVPFHNVEVSALSRIHVDYNFNPHQQTLVCTDNGFGGLSSVKWIYKDVSYKSMMPVTLQDDKRFEGQLADPSGRLVITNESTGELMRVSCEYRNMN
ncbi:MAG: hypothetical protein H0W64_05020 [Gammaproteobacteria bacterium]|nr:hypothetical protein [Gammaproteobacteria bacterium]